MRPATLFVVGTNYSLSRMRCFPDIFEICIALRRRSLSGGGVKASG